ncbi:MAG: ArsR family transcriptional regulator [Thermoprotei archaeon]|nr:MAG: ArsR family transcriptional regulator [Thermoprotei archaeon]
MSLETKEEVKLAIPKNPGIYEVEDTLVVRGEEYVQKVSSALSSITRLRILKYLREGGMYVGKAAELIAQSKANASAQIRILESVRLVKSSYEPGKRGVKKISRTNIKKVLLILD